MAFTKSDKSDAPMRRKGGMHRRKKVCVFCGKDNVIDYKRRIWRKIVQCSVLKVQKRVVKRLFIFRSTDNPP